LAKFSQKFKAQAVEDALSRPSNHTVQEVANNLGVGYSTLQKWIGLAKDNKLEVSNDMGSGEKSPQDWDRTERLGAVMNCHEKTEEQISSYCREHGIYPHHVEQWKAGFISENQAPDGKSKNEQKKLKLEIKELKRELNRKEKALCEAAALLVLSKKCQAIWGEQEEG